MSIKDAHLQRLSAALKEIQCICTESIALTSDNPCVQKVCHCLDRVFLDGLKTPSRGYWDLLVELSHKDLVREIKASRYLLTNHGRARAWLFRVLSESLLESYLASLAGDVALLRRYYEPHALLADSNRTRLLQTLLSGLEHCDLSCVSWSTVTFLDVGCIDPAKRNRGDTESGSSGSLGGLQDGPAASATSDNPQSSSTSSQELQQHSHLLSEVPPSPLTLASMTQQHEQISEQLPVEDQSLDFNSITMSQDDSLVVERKLTHRQRQPGAGGISSSNYYRLTMADSEEDDSLPPPPPPPQPPQPPVEEVPVGRASRASSDHRSSPTVEIVQDDESDKETTPVISAEPLKMNGNVKALHPHSSSPPQQQQQQQQKKQYSHQGPLSLPLPMSMPLTTSGSTRRQHDFGGPTLLARSLADELLEAEEAAARQAAARSGSEADADDNTDAAVDSDADVEPEMGAANAEADADAEESSSTASDAVDAPSPFDPAALSSDYALEPRQVQDALGDPSIAAAYRALWWRGDAWTACMLCLSAGRAALIASGSLVRLCEWRPESLDHVCQSGQGHLLHLVGVTRSTRHFVACVDQSIGESAARALRRCLPTVPLFRGSPCQDVGLGKWLRTEAPSLSGAPLYYSLATHEMLLDAKLPVRPPKGDWSRRRLLLSGGWLLAAPGEGGPQWSLAGCRGCQMAQDAETDGAVVEVTLAGGDVVLIGGQRALAWKQAICSAMVRSGGGSASKVLTLLVTEQGLALGSEVPGQWTVETIGLAALEEIRSLGYDPHYPTYLTLRLRPPTTWLLCLGSAEERNRLGRLLRHLLPGLPLRRLPTERTSGLRASARALTLLCEQTLP